MTTLPKRLLVTGASGFLGSMIVGMAREAGWTVRALYRNPRKVDGIESCVGNIGEIATLRKASEGVAAVVHAAGMAHVFGASARNPTRFYEVNEAGTDNLVQAALGAGVSHIVLVSSVAVYGTHADAECDETIACQPQGHYAKSKWQGEQRAIERMTKGDGALTILRFATIYGEGDRGNVARLIGALDRGRFIWPGSGENQKSLIYRQDAARACICALERPARGTELFNVSSSPASMRAIVTTICGALGRPTPRLEIPLPVLKTVGAIWRAVGDPGHLDQRLQKFIRDDVYSGQKFERTFSFSPQVSLVQGMRREVEWLKGRAAGPDAHM